MEMGWRLQEYFGRTLEQLPYFKRLLEGARIKGEIKLTKYGNTLSYTLLIILLLQALYSIKFALVPIIGSCPPNNTTTLP